MKSRIITMLIGFMIVMSAAQLVSARVSTQNKADDSSNSIYVIGKDDYYPFEYYDDKSKEYKGVMPKILQAVSKKSGIDFTYIRSINNDKTELAENMQAELVSVCLPGDDISYARDDISVFSYSYNGETIQAGWAFTEIADRELIDAVESVMQDLTSQQINGYLISSLGEQPQTSKLAVYVLITCCVLLAALFFLAVMKLKKSKREIWKSKMTDPGTGMGNSAYFEYCFKNVISDISRSLYYVAYIITDADYLRAYYGEEASASIAEYIAGVLNSQLRQNEFAARINEYGFAVAFQSTNAREAENYVNEILNKLSVYTKENEEILFFYAAAYKLHAGERNCELILYNLQRNCDKLMDSETRFVLCDSNMMNKADEEKRLLESISKGLENNEFKLYLHFVINNKTKEISSAEALSRWDSPDEGLISPAKYISMMSSYGLVAKLDYYMFEGVCSQLAKWKDSEFSAYSISCNFTRITISENDFVKTLSDIADKYDFDREKLIMEITEDAIEKNREVAKRNIFECKKLGFRIALDDMGSGYTSLVNLCEYPIDIVKIDRDILLKTGTKNGRDLFGGIIALAHNLGLTVVCEGVETPQHNELVDSSQCDYVQGWYYSRVLPVREGEKFAREYTQKLKSRI